MSNSALVPLRKSTAAATVGNAGGRASLVGASAPVALALSKVLVSFAAPQQNDLDFQLLFSVYCEVIEGIPESVVLYALKRLQTKNPRNPFRPSPQDLYEACKDRLKDLHGEVLRYFQTYGADSIWPPSLGPPPFADGSGAPESVACAAVETILLEQRHYERCGQGLCSATRFATIPSNLLKDDDYRKTLETTLGFLVKRDENRAAWRKFEETYLASLDPMARRVREGIVGSRSDWHQYRDSSDEDRKIPPADVEAQIMKEMKAHARQLIARELARCPVSQYEWNRMQNSHRWKLISDAEAELDAHGWEGYPAFLRLDHGGA